jgi:hypothetical protein
VTLVDNWLIIEGVRVQPAVTGDVPIFTGLHILIFFRNDAVRLRVLAE